MTTHAAAAYLGEHLQQWNGRPLAVFNPHEKPLADLPTIYGFNNGGSPGFMFGQLIAEDGVPLGGHCCSHEGYMPGDLGLLDGSRPDRHEHFRAHYPDGYRMAWVPYAEVDGHAGLNEAFAKNELLKSSEEQPTEAAPSGVATGSEGEAEAPGGTHDRL